MHHQNKTPLKVAHAVIYYARDYKGGIQKYLENVSREQNKSILTSILTTTAFSRKNNDFRAFRTKSWGIIMRTPISPAFITAPDQQDADLIHLHGPNPLLDLMAAASRKPYVITLHNTFPQAKGTYRLANPLAKVLLQRTLRGAKKIFIHQENFLQSLKMNPNEIKNLQKKISIIPPGVDHSLFHSGREEKTKTIVFLAHLRPEKGLHILRESMRYLQNRQGITVKLLLTRSYGGNYAKKEEALWQKTMDKKCVLMENPSQQEIVAALQTAGCFVCPSIGLESWNLALLEAAACGAAIVRTDLPGLSWLDPRACVVARAGDPRDLGQKIDSVWQKQRILGARAQQEAQKFSWEKTAAQLINAYYDVINS